MNNKVILFALGILIVSCSGVAPKSHEDDYSEYIVSDVREHLTDTLFHNGHDFISSVEVQIIGYVGGSAIIEFDNGADRLEKILLADSVKYIYKTEWYENSLYFAYTPIDTVSMGNIKLMYKFR